MSEALKRDSHGRYRKGQSGNPGGRPKQELPVADENLNATILEVARRRIKVAQDGSEPGEISVEDAMIRKLYEIALKGDVQAIKALIPYLERAKAAERAQIDANNKYWHRYKAEWPELAAEASEKGQPEPLPHPDDITICDGKRVKFSGPINAEDLKSFQRTCSLRDQLILQAALERKDPKHDPKTPTSSQKIAVLGNKSLPARMQRSRDEMIEMQMQAERLSKRLLLKLIYQGWKDLGYDIPRGAKMVSADLLDSLMALCVAVCRECHGQDLTSEEQGQIIDDLVQLHLG